MKWFQNIETLKDLRKEYRRLVLKYHPDNGGDENVIKEVNYEYDILFKKMKHDFEQDDTYSNATDKQKQSYDWQKDSQIRDIILQLAKFGDNISVEVIGTWIWISGGYEYRKELKELGFHWAREKKRWYIHFNDYYKFGLKPTSMSYIRSKYGVIKVKFKKEQQEDENRRIKAL